MARWDVYRNNARRGSTDTPYLLDVQANLLSHLQSRVVVPLRAAASVKRPIDRLQPRLSVRGEELVMDTPAIVGAPVESLGAHVDNLNIHASELLGALDLLLTGA